MKKELVPVFVIALLSAVGYLMRERAFWPVEATINEINNAGGVATQGYTLSNSLLTLEAWSESINRYCKAKNSFYSSGDFQIFLPCHDNYEEHRTRTSFSSENQMLFF